MPLQFVHIQYTLTEAVRAVVTEVLSRSHSCSLHYSLVLVLHNYFDVYLLCYPPHCACFSLSAAASAADGWNCGAEAAIDFSSSAPERATPSAGSSHLHRHSDTWWRLCRLCLLTGSNANRPKNRVFLSASTNTPGATFSTSLPNHPSIVNARQ